MAAVCQPRRALVEIQPKIAARIRRSYQEVLGAQLTPPRSRSPTTNSRRAQSLDSSASRLWPGGLDDHPATPPSSGLDEHQATPLTKQQLVQLIRALILVEQSQELRALTSDLKHLQEDLQLKKMNVYRSIPYSRLGSNRDAHCYRKAYPHLVAFNVSCEEWGQVLLRNQAWDSVVEHTLLAWRSASELPQWDRAAHNALRDQCYATLAAHCLAALQNLRPGACRARQLLRRLKMAQVHSQSIAPCVQQLERILTDAQDSSMDTH